MMSRVRSAKRPGWALAVPLAVGCFLSAHLPWLHRHLHQGAHATFVHPGHHDSASGPFGVDLRRGERRAIGSSAREATADHRHLHPHPPSFPAAKAPPSGPDRPDDRSSSAESEPLSGEESGDSHVHVLALIADDGWARVAAAVPFFPVLLTSGMLQPASAPTTEDVRLHFPRGPPRMRG